MKLISRNITDFRFLNPPLSADSFSVADFCVSMETFPHKNRFPSQGSKPATEDGFVFSDCRAGFTLVEIITAMAVFGVVVTIAVGGFAYALRAQRQANALLAVQSNVSEAVEQMSREIRLGKSFCNENTQADAASCNDGTDWSGGCRSDELAFVNAFGNQVIYRYGTDPSGGGTIMREVWRMENNGCTQYGPDPITADNVDVRDLRFLLSGEGPSDGLQVRVTFSITVSPEDISLPDIGATTIQSTLSPRTFDN